MNDNPAFATIDGGVTAPKGFRAAGVNAGIRNEKLDLALIASDVPASVAGTFTQNKIQGATVKLCRQRLKTGIARAVVVNSGNANACNGRQGQEDAVAMGKLVAEELHVAEETVFVCSTGTIGIPMPMEKLEKGIPEVVAGLSGNGGDLAARAIMTTDTVPKEVAVRLTIDGKEVSIGGIAKGAGMIEPNMATMLSFLTTDAAVEPRSLQACLIGAVDESFNRVSVDGDQSCNDTVLFMANGQAGNTPLNEQHRDWSGFVAAVRHVALELALMIARDGEGSTRLVTVIVKGAISVPDAMLAARAVANSLLVKTSWYGGDPNWGRVIDAVGYSGAEVTEELVDISYDDVCAVKNGQRAGDTALSDLEEVLKKKEFTVVVDLNLGNGMDKVYTCDCSEEYVRINSEYMT